MKRNGAWEVHDSPELVSSLPTPNPTTATPPMDRLGVKRLRYGAGVDGDLGREDKKAKSEAPEEEGAFDLVSCLPLELACDVFSRLSTIDGVSTTAVCHTWKQIWLDTPISVNDGELGVGPDDIERRKMIIDCIIKTHPLPFGRFQCSYVRLTPMLMPILMANLQLWFAHPRFDSLDEVVLLFPRDGRSADRALPYTALRFPVVRVIIIANCSIQARCEIVSARLIVLELHRVVISSDTMHYILSRSQKLEALKLIRNIGIGTLSLNLKRLRQLYLCCYKKELTNLTIIDAESLEELYVNQYAHGPSVAINSAPMLRTLGYIGLETPQFYIGDLKFRQCSAVKMIGHCATVTTLAVKMLFPDLNYTTDFLNLFPCLESLHILFVDRSQLTYPSERTAGRTCFSNLEGPMNCLKHTLRNIYFWNYPQTDHHLEFTNYFIERCNVLKHVVFATKEWHWPLWTDSWTTQMNLRHLASPRVQFHFASAQPALSVGRLPIIKDDPFGEPFTVYRIMVFEGQGPDAQQDDDDEDDDGGDGGDGDEDEQDEGDEPEDNGSSREKENQDRGLSEKNPDARRENRSNRSSSSEGLSKYGGSEYWKEYRKTLCCSYFLPSFEQEPTYEGPIEDGFIQILSVIDSRCVLSRNDQAFALCSVDEPLLAERQRIEATGHTAVTVQMRHFTCVNDGIVISRSADNPSLAAQYQALPCFYDVLTEEITVGTHFLRARDEICILEAYKSGCGRIVVRGKSGIETIDVKSKREAIVIKEIPYQANKATLVEKIAELVEEKVLEGISDIRDESDRTGMRVIIELKRSADPAIVLNNLYSHTALQSSFSCNMVAILDGQPKLMGLKEILQKWSILDAY